MRPWKQTRREKDRGASETFWHNMRFVPGSLSVSAPFCGDGYPADYVDESIGLNIHELASVSAVDYGRIYGRIFAGVEGALYIALTVTLAVAALLTLLFAALNKPIGAIVFDVISFAVYHVMVYDLIDRGVLPDSRWKWSISYYLLNIVPVMMLAIAIWMLAVKRRRKKHITSSNN